MINVKFYLDKADKSKRFPIHLVLRQKDLQIKVATGEKIMKKDWDNTNQLVKETEYSYKSINKFLNFLKQEVEKYFEIEPHTNFTDKKIKEKIWQQAEAMMEEGVPGKTPLLKLDGVKGDAKMQAYIKISTQEIIEELLKQFDTKKIKEDPNHSPMQELNQLVVDIFEKLEEELSDKPIKPILGGMCRIAVEATTDVMGRRPGIPIPDMVAKSLGMA